MCHLIIQVMNSFLFEDRASCCWMSLGNIDDTFNFILYLDLKTFFPFKSIGKQYIIQLIELLIVKTKKNPTSVFSIIPLKQH